MLFVVYFFEYASVSQRVLLCYGSGCLALAQKITAAGGEYTVLAIRTSGHTDSPAVKHKTVAEIIGLGHGQTVPKLHLGFVGVFGVAQPQPV